MTVEPALTPLPDVPNPPKTSRFRKGKKKDPRNPATPGQVAIKLRQLRRDNGYRTTMEAAKAAHVNVSLLHRLESYNHRKRDFTNRLRYGKTIAALAFCYSVKPEDILLISPEEDVRLQTSD